MELDVYIPRVGREQADLIAEKAHRLCPYSNATGGNIPVKVTIVE